MGNWRNLACRGVRCPIHQHDAIRLLVPGDVVATRGMVAARRRWLALETLLGTRFYWPVGVVTAWPRERVAGVLATAIAVSVVTAGVGSCRVRTGC